MRRHSDVLEGHLQALADDHRSLAALQTGSGRNPLAVVGRCLIRGAAAQPHRAISQVLESVRQIARQRIGPHSAERRAGSKPLESLAA